MGASNTTHVKLSGPPKQSSTCIFGQITEKFCQTKLGIKFMTPGNTSLETLALFSAVKKLS
jgi:hypothetical protein